MVSFFNKSKFKSLTILALFLAIQVALMDICSVFAVETDCIARTSESEHDDLQENSNSASISDFERYNLSDDQKILAKSLCSNGLWTLLKIFESSPEEYRSMVFAELKEVEEQSRLSFLQYNLKIITDYIDHQKKHLGLSGFPDTSDLKNLDLEKIQKEFLSKSQKKITFWDKVDCQVSRAGQWLKWIVSPVTKACEATNEKVITPITQKAFNIVLNSVASFTYPRRQDSEERKQLVKLGMFLATGYDDDIDGYPLGQGLPLQFASSQFFSFLHDGLCENLGISLVKSITIQVNGFRSDVKIPIKPGDANYDQYLLEQITNKFYLAGHISEQTKESILKLQDYGLKASAVINIYQNLRYISMLCHCIKNNVSTPPLKTGEPSLDFFLENLCEELSPMNKFHKILAIMDVCRKTEDIYKNLCFIRGTVPVIFMKDSKARMAFEFLAKYRCFVVAGVQGVKGLCDMQKNPKRANKPCQQIIATT
jgi:hypothetical protein